MVRHPLLEVPSHCTQGGIIHRDMVGIDPKDLAPAFTASSLDGHIDVREGLIDLLFDVLRDLTIGRIPSTF